MGASSLPCPREHFSGKAYHTLITHLVDAMHRQHCLWKVMHDHDHLHSIPMATTPPRTISANILDSRKDDSRAMKYSAEVHSPCSTDYITDNQSC